MSPFGTSRHFATAPNLSPFRGIADTIKPSQTASIPEYAYFDEPTTIGAKGSGGPAVASFFASASTCPTLLPNGSSSEECPLIEIDRKRPAHDQSYAIDPSHTLATYQPTHSPSGSLAGEIDSPTATSGDRALALAKARGHQTVTTSQREIGS
jgi:hypothetical protein